ncbi:MAG: Pr6Pr family membrane protein [Gemmatimonadota bacterium]
MRLILGTTTAALAWAALVLQIGLNLSSGVDPFGNPRTPWMSMVDLFGYFTILTNLLVALVITIPAVAPKSVAAGFFSNLRTTWTAAAAIVVVGIAYHVLLSAQYNPTGLGAWTDLAFHYLVPTLFAVYWVTTSEVGGARFLPQIGVLSLYPFAYFVYVIGRGEVLGTYPYFFVDVRTLGLLGALKNALGILVFYLFVAWVLALLAGWVSRRRTSRA